MADQNGVLGREGVRLGLKAADKWDAVRQSGALLDELGAVEAGHPEAMSDRERTVSTFIGEGVAIPHGTLAGKDQVSRSAMVVLGFPDGVDWAGQRAEVCIGIAAAAGGHVALVARLAEILLDPQLAARLRGARDPEEIRTLFSEDSGAR